MLKNKTKKQNKNTQKKQKTFFLAKKKKHGAKNTFFFASLPIAHTVPALTLLISTLPNSLRTTINTLIPLSCYIHICHPSLCTGALYKHHASP